MNGGSSELANEQVTETVERRKCTVKNYPSITRNNVCTIRIVVLANLLLQEKVWSKVSIATIHHYLGRSLYRHTGKELHTWLPS